jgi:hypothetical protein
MASSFTLNRRWRGLFGLTVAMLVMQLLGQSDFNAHEAGTTQSTMQRPYGLDIDTGGRLWVSDTVNNRVLRFDNAAGRPDGAPADGVLGQMNFTSNASGGADAYNQPRGIATDPSGRLYVANTFNNTVLWYDVAASKPNGASADGRLGRVAGTSASLLSLPNDVFYHLDSDTLWVADGSNNRVLRFETFIPPTSTPTDTPTNTPTPTDTPTSTPTDTPTPTPTDTPPPTSISTSIPTDTSTFTLTSTSTPPSTSTNAPTSTATTVPSLPATPLPLSRRIYLPITVCSR